MSAVPPPAPSTASAAPRREGDDAAQAERAVAGHVGLGDQETCAGAQQRDAQEHHGSAAIVAPRDRRIAADPIDCRACPPRSCRPRAGRCSATATASACAPAPSRACAARGARASAWWRSRWRSRPPSTPPRSRSPRGGRARIGSASSTPIAIASRWPRSAARGRARRPRRRALRARRRALARAGGRRAGDGRRRRRGRRRLRLRARRRRRRRTGRASSPRRCTCPRSRWRAAASGVTLTLAAIAAPDDDRRRLCARLLERAGRCASAPLPLLDPAPTGRYRVVSAMPPEHYEAAVARAVERIRAGALDKVVLAREVQVHAPRAHDAAAVLGVLREALPVVLHLLRGARRQRVRRRQPRAARAPRRPARRRRSRWRARRGAAPTPPSTTTSASSCCAPTRTARSRRSSRGASCARCAR